MKCVRNKVKGDALIRELVRVKALQMEVTEEGCKTIFGFYRRYIGEEMLPEARS